MVFSSAAKSHTNPAVMFNISVCRSRPIAAMPPVHQLSFEKNLYELEERLLKLEAQPDPSPAEKESMRRMRVELTQMTRERYQNLDAWQTVQVSRHPERPQTPDYLELVFDEFVELHGDRSFGDDRAIITGFAKLAGDRKSVV